jgi:hypothetical protein
MEGRLLELCRGGGGDEGDGDVDRGFAGLLASGCQVFGDERSSTIARMEVVV